MRELIEYLEDAEAKLLIERLRMERARVHRILTCESEVPARESEIEIPFKQIAYRISFRTRNDVDLEFEFSSDYVDESGYFMTFPDAFSSAVYDFSIDRWAKERLSLTQADIDDAEALLARMKQILSEWMFLRDRINNFVLGCPKPACDE